MCVSCFSDLLRFPEFSENLLHLGKTPKFIVMTQISTVTAAEATNGANSRKNRQLDNIAGSRGRDARTRQ